MSLLELGALSMSIHGIDVLRNVTLSVEEGEIVAITGESGSGKSMTALSTLQLLPRGARCTGSVMLDGQDLAALSEEALCDVRGNTVGMVFQEPMTALNPVPTCLLYTSPSPRDRQKSRMPSSA